MKKIIAALMLALMLAVFAFGCTQPAATDDGGGVIDIIGETPKPVQTETPTTAAPLALALYAPEGTGMLAAGALHTVGLRTDGTVATAGHSLYGQLKVKEATDVAYIASGDKLVAAVMKNGTVTLYGEQTEELTAAVGAWTDISTAAVGDGFVVGLKKDGTVVAAGDNTAKQCDVTAWTGIVMIDAAGKHTVGLKSDGTVVATGDNAEKQCDVTAWSGIVYVAAGAHHTVGVVQDGTVVSTTTAEYAPAASWSDVKRVFAGDAATVGITNAGAVLVSTANAAIPAADVSAVTGAVYAACGANHIAILKDDGRVVSFGTNEDLQGDVGRFILRPYLDGNGNYVGLSQGMMASAGVDFVKKLTGSDAITFKLNGTETGDAEMVCTGMEIYKDGALYGTIAVLGDVDGDGSITDADQAALTAHFEGTTKLEGAALRAGSILFDSEGKPASASVDSIAAHIAGTKYISQLSANIELFEEAIAEAKAINKEVIGWFRVPGTDIDFPILHDNSGKWYYNDHDINRDKSNAGTVYAYYSAFAKNNAFTGHNMRVSGTMLHPLHHVQEYNLGQTNCTGKDCGAELTSALPDLKTFAGRTWTISIHGVESKWEMFAMYETPAGEDKDTLFYNTWWPTQTSIDTGDEIQEWINKQVSRSEIKIDTEVTIDDTFVTLLTCGNEYADASKNARLYFFFKQVD